MNLMQLILRQMRQRALSTFLTCLSILLGMTLATSILILSREGRTLFAQTDYGFDLLVGPKASPVQLVFNTIYHVDLSPGNIPYHLYEDMASGSALSADGKANPFRGMVRWAVPYAVGDNYKGRRIVGTTPQLFGVDDAGKPLPEEKVPHYRHEQRYTFAAGRAFAPNKFEAVIGADVARTLNLAIGDTFKATHGIPTSEFMPTDEHPEVWKVVGILNETHTANDRVLFIPLLTFYCIFEHEEGLEKINGIRAGAAASAAAPVAAPAMTAAAKEEEKAYTLNADGTVNVKLPKAEWEISAILVQTQSAFTSQQMQFTLRNLPDAIGVSPANEMAKFLDAFLPNIRLVFLIISSVVTVVAGFSILVSIYNSVAARNREIAIMRALGATRARILAAICAEAGCIGLLGGLLGLLFGHLVAAAGSAALQRALGSGISWWRFDAVEMLYLLGIIAVSLLAGLVPGLKAYRTPVAENLVAG